MKKLFIGSALLLSAFAFTSLQAKENTVQADGANRELTCRRGAYEMANDCYEYGSYDWQVYFMDLRNECLGR